MLALVASLVVCAPPGPTWALFPQEVVRRVDHQNADPPRLTFTSGTVLERVSEDNDCTLAEGFRFVDAALDSGAKPREAPRK